ncbi:unnamed protein product [Schistosoma mattheei]|uniref:Uncharacterized protein n=2 Tax=Schistosoma TaxID=6181 RepID=A0A183KRH2_9TREM|nr:unnamed protein product [Schistosoma curassoni]VDP65522.1 unnamed protein product [Schistosoma mattheei]
MHYKNMYTFSSLNLIIRLPGLTCFKSGLKSSANKTVRMVSASALPN